MYNIAKIPLLDRKDLFETYSFKYGIAIAFGEVNVNNILLGETIGGKTVLTATDTELDGEGYFYIVLYGVPEASYTQDVTARAYVILNDGSVFVAGTADIFVVDNCYAYFRGSRGFRFEGIATNITFTNNTITGEYTISGDKWASGVCDAIRFIAGIKTSLIVQGNNFSKTAQTFFYFDNYYEGTYIFTNNIFDEFHRAAIDYREPQNGSTLRTINVIHNTFRNADNNWSAFRARTSGITSGKLAVNMNYNIFENLANYENLFERSNGSLTGYANCDKNYCDVTLSDAFFNGGATHANWYATKDALEAAYLAYLAE